LQPRTRLALVVAFFVAVVAFDLAFLFGFAKGDLLDRTRLYLTFLAIYGFAVGFVAQARALSRLEVLQEMTSPHPVVFVAGNFRFLAVVFTAFAVAMDSRTLPGDRTFFLRVPAIVAFSLLFAAYAVFHVLVVVPLAYLPYALASAPLAGILRASRDMSVVQTRTLPDGAVDRQAVSIRETVRESEVALRSFLVGVPAFALSQGLGLARGFL
jgi:hypothetical protein